MADGKISDDTLIASVDGTEYFPLIQAGVNVRMMLTTLIALCSAGVEVTDVSKRNALKLYTNWVNPDSADDVYYPIMTNNIVTGQNEFDYYIGYNSVTNSIYKFTYLKIDGTLKWVRVMIALNVPTA